MAVCLRRLRCSVELRSRYLIDMPSFGNVCDVRMDASFLKKAVSSPWVLPTAIACIATALGAFVACGLRWVYTRHVRRRTLQTAVEVAANAPIDDLDEHELEKHARTRVAALGESDGEDGV